MLEQLRLMLQMLSQQSQQLKQQNTALAQQMSVSSRAAVNQAALLLSTRNSSNSSR